MSAWAPSAFPGCERMVILSMVWTQQGLGVWAGYAHYVCGMESVWRVSWLFCRVNPGLSMPYMCAERPPESGSPGAVFAAFQQVAAPTCQRTAHGHLVGNSEMPLYWANPALRPSVPSSFQVARFCVNAVA